MVAVFAIEAGRLQRPPTDIDIRGDARQRPSGTQTVAERLKLMGGSLRGSLRLRGRARIPL
jgi:hypothetical protein